MMFQSTQSAFNLDVINYENPGGDPTHEDRNLLLTCLQLVDKSRRWETIAPLLYTWEVQYLQNWLSDILMDREVPDRLGFMEPCVSIHLNAVSHPPETFCFRFLLSYEAAPPWWLMPLDNPYILSVDCTKDTIRQAIGHLTDQLASFPVRS